MVHILSYHMGLQGSNINLLDFNEYIKTKDDVIFYTRDTINLLNTIKQTKRNYKIFNLQSITDYKADIDAIVYTDFKSIIKLYQDDIKIECKKLVVFDNNELSYHLNDSKNAKFYHEKINVETILSTFKYDEVLFLMPPSNIKKFTEKYPNINKEVFFKKINYELLDKIPYSKKDMLWYRFDDIDIQEKMEEKYGIFVETRDQYDEINLWDYKGMIYYRRKHLDYYEQLGRLIFEFILLGKEVHFLNDPFEVQDGLSDYLKYYDIKFDDKYTVTTTAKELINKMNIGYNFQFLKGK